MGLIHDIRGGDRLFACSTCSSPLGIAVSGDNLLLTEVLTVPVARIGALLPFAMMVVILLFRPRGLMGTRATHERRVVSSKTWIWIAALALAIAAALGHSIRLGHTGRQSGFLVSMLSQMGMMSHPGACRTTCCWGRPACSRCATRRSSASAVMPPSIF